MKRCKSRCKQRERVPISPEQLKKLLEALPEPTRSIASLLVFTGLRAGELLVLRWRDVDLDGGVLRVTQTVNDGLSYSEDVLKHRPAGLDSDSLHSM